jgi:hypothetical protein
LAVIAAQTASLAGCWNEYTPKFGSLVLWIPAMLWILSFSEATLSFLFLITMTVAGLGQWPYIAEMDGALALYAASAVLLLGRYFGSQRKIDLLSAVLCVCATPNLKNEGFMFVISLVVASLGCSLALWVRIKRNPICGNFNNKLIPMVVGSMAIVPTLIWSHLRLKWGLINSLNVGQKSFFVAIQSGFTDGITVSALFKNFFLVQMLGKTLLLFVVAAMALIVLRRHVPRSSLLAAATGFIYLGGMFVIFLSLSTNLNFYLHTAAERTLLPVSACVLVGTFFMLRALERDSNQKPQITTVELQ